MQKAEVLQMFDHYSNMVYRLALSYLHHTQDAEDAVQAVFLKLIDGTATPMPGKEKAYLIQITVNYCKDMLRSVWRRQVEPIEETMVFEDKKNNDLFHAVMELPVKYRIVIHLHYYEGYSFPEIAEVLKISSSGVSMRIHRGRKILKEKLKEDYDEK